MRPVTLAVLARLATAFLTTALLVSCGGGGGGGEPPPPPAAVAPSITQQPASLSVVDGASATFSVSATGSATLVYQWMRGGADVAGASGSSYTLPAAALADSGSSWTVRVSNAAGSVVSAAAALTVTARPVEVPPGISYFAGEDQKAGFANGSGRAARFDKPTALAIDAQGNVFVADWNNGAIRKMTPAGEVTTPLTSVNAPCLSGVRDLAFNGQGVLHVISRNSASGSSKLCRLAADGSTTLEIAGMNLVAPAPDGSVFAASANNVYRIDATGVATSLTGSATATVLGITGLAVDAGGNAYIAHFLGGATRETALISRISPQGSVTFIAGGENLADVNTLVVRVDGTGAAARFFRPQGLALDPAGNLLVVDPGYGVRKVTPAGQVSTPPGLPVFRTTLSDQEGDLAVDPSGTVYFVTGHGVGKFSPDGTPVPLAGTALPGDHVPMEATGIAADTAGNVYVLQSLGGVELDLRVQKFAPDGRRLPFGADPGGVKIPVPSVARISSWTSMALDGTGNLFVSHALIHQDFLRAPSAGGLYKVAPDGTASVVASYPKDDPRFFVPHSLSADPGGNVYFVDLALNQQKLMRIGTGDSITKVADLPHRGAYFFSDPLPRLAVGSSGVIYYVETQGTTTVSLLQANGQLTPVPGVAANTSVASPVADEDGHLLFLDNGLLRRLTPQGAITTVAGQNGIANAYGPLPGNLASPSLLKIGPQGLLYVQAGQSLVRIRLK